MREYKYTEKCPHCGKWIVIALSDKQRYLPNVYTESEGYSRKEGHAFDLKKPETQGEPRNDA